MSESKKLKEVAKVFFKMGVFAFGGPAAHIAMMEDEIVKRRKWMDQQHFLDLIGATNLIPGPNSTEMTMHCGHERAGFKGLIIAGLSFILPAIFITGLLGFLYVEYGQLPEVEPFIFGIKPAVLAIIASAVFKLGKKAIKGWELGALGAVVLSASLLGVNEVLALLGAGVLGAVYFTVKAKLANTAMSFTPFLATTALGSLGLKLSSLNVFWTFLKVGAVLYGSGYVLFAYLDAELVERGWLTRQELLDAIAVGQFTPGPVLSTATFIGYQLTGFWGAIGASVGIFLPSFIFVLLLNPFVSKMKKSKPLRFFLNSVNVSAVAVMAGVLFTMSTETLINWQAILIATISVVVTFVLKKVNVMYTILGGSLLGYILNLDGLF